MHKLQNDHYRDRHFEISYAHLASPKNRLVNQSAVLFFSSFCKLTFDWSICRRQSVGNKPNSIVIFCGTFSLWKEEPTPVPLICDMTLFIDVMANFVTEN
jgi:hypothetical protein